MNDILKNPIALLFAGLLALWLIFKVVKSILSLFGVVVIVFIVLFIVNDRFRAAIRGIFDGLFNKN